MGLFPRSTNAEYGGSIASAWVLVAAGILTIVPGCIHYFLPDGGAGVIAGIDLSQRAETIFAMFAWMGAQQIPQGIAYVVIGLWYRTLTPLFLFLIVLERGLMSYDGWFGKGAVSGHHPPEHYLSVAAVVLGAFFLVLALRNARETGR